MLKLAMNTLYSRELFYNYFILFKFKNIQIIKILKLASITHLYNLTYDMLSYKRTS